jgi:hypothetical protein
MSAALSEIERELAQLTPEERKKRRKEMRKKREISRRFVITCPDEIGLWANTKYANYDANSPAQFLRLMVLEGMRSKGISAAMLRANMAQVIAERAAKEAEEAMAALEAESGNTGEA